MDLKIISYNLNGIRAAMRKGLTEWLERENPDILLVQEIKAHPEQISLEEFEKAGYKCYFHSAVKRGYSGVGIFTKPSPDQVKMGCGMEKYDIEGRVLRADYGDVSILSTYFPSGSSGDTRQAFKMKFLRDFEDYAAELIRSGRKLIISGDYNICHKPIDIHNPVSNKNSSGFLPEEREWMTRFTDMGFVDSFRHFHESETGKYTWWTYRFNARRKNLGWRIDYHMVSEALKDNMRQAEILSDACHSDHCPISLHIDLN